VSCILLTGFENVTVRGDPLIASLAEKYKCTPNQVTLSWHLARGVAVVTASKNVERQKENRAVSPTFLPFPLCLAYLPRTIPLCFLAFLSVVLTFNGDVEFHSL